MSIENIVGHGEKPTRADLAPDQGKDGMPVGRLVAKILQIDRRWLIAAVIVGLVSVFTAGNSGFYKLFSLLHRKKQLEKKIEMETIRETILKRQVDSLQSNQQYIEKFVREQHKMGAEDEILYTVEP